MNEIFKYLMPEITKQQYFEKNIYNLSIYFFKNELNKFINDKISLKKFKYKYF